MLRAFFEAVPIVVICPIVDGAAANAEEFGYFGFGKVCLEKQAFGLLPIVLFHLFGVLSGQENCFIGHYFAKLGNNFYNCQIKGIIF